MPVLQITWTEAQIPRWRSAIIAALHSLTACEENLAPRENVETPFALYGVLSPELATHSVRLYEVEAFPTLGSPDPLNVDVFSTDLHTGERLTWSDSVVVDPNGQYEHVFWAPFQAEFGREYRIEAVRRSDGANSFAEVRIPSQVTVRINDQDASAMMVFIEGDRIRALKPEAIYQVNKGELPRHPNDPIACPLRSYSISYEGRERPIEHGWQVGFNMVVDQNKILFSYVGETGCIGGCPSLSLRSLKLRVLVGDAEWDPPGGVFNPDILSEPNTMSNVVNGFGFIGAGYRIEEPLYPSREAVEYACFVHAF